MRAFHRFHRQLGVDNDGRDVRRVVYLALGAGVLLAVIKTVAAVMTDSASMLAEAVHSWVGTVTDGFLVAAYLAARRPPDATHVLGYGRESYVWSLFGSVAMLTVGAEVGVWRGLHQLGTADMTTDYAIGYVVLAGSFVLQTWSFAQAVAFVRKRAAELEHGVFAHVFKTSDAQLRTVVIGDFIALVGIVVAAAGMALHQWTGKVAWDAAGSFIVGLLMGVGGLYLILTNRRFLAGAPLSPAQRLGALRALAAMHEVKRVTWLYGEFIGPERVVVVARVELKGEHSQAELARTLRRLELSIMTNRYIGRVTLSLSAPEEPDAH
ncbi:cation diffusion facilitator family transporter [Variovorax rhizosphaerae]|uniref:Cation diffusion facilitator family transporter n=1 Tax=Variovorax rhizosphaerae TaxID=1836200 RepID=A0ABU8WQ16_9BURK